VCAQVADALHDAHRVGVVHRDVKPTNVLLRDADTFDLHAYLCDFGIARTAGQGFTTPGSVAGTWSYLAPECGRGEPGTPSSDVYALGCLFWAALTGAAPYRGNDVEIAVAHQQAPVPQLGGDDPFSRKASQILARSMAKTAAERYATADELRVDLAEAATLTAGAALDPIYPPSPVASDHGTARRAARLSLGGGSTAGRGGSGTAGRAVGAGAAGAAGAAGSGAAGPRGGARRTALVVGAAALAVVVVAGGAFGLTRALSGDGGDGPGTAAPGSGQTTDGPATGGAEGPVTSDFDGDGLGDLQIYASFPDPDGDKGNLSFADLSVWRSDGSAFAEAGSDELDRTTDYAAFPFQGRVDGDDATDRLVLRIATVEGEPQTLTVLGSTSDGTDLDQELDVPEDFAGFPTMADLDGDGDDDLVLQQIVANDQPVQLFASRNDEGEFGSLEPYFEVPDSESTRVLVAFGDYDGDGTADLSAIDRGERLDGNRDLYPYVISTWYRRDGDLEEGATREVRGSFSANLAADIDGDGDDEIVLPQPSFRAIKMRVLETDGEEISAPFARGLVEPRSTQVIPPLYGVTDPDGDGRDDVVMLTSTGATEATFFLFRSDGSTFAASDWGTYPGPWPAGLDPTIPGGSL